MRLWSVGAILLSLSILVLVGRDGGASLPAIAAAKPTPTVLTVHVSLKEPEGLSFDSHGNLYVADTGHSRVMELSSSGRVLHTWGTHGTKPGQFDLPSSVAVDSQGTLYVADFNNRRLQKLSSAGNQLGQWKAGDPKFGCECRDVTVDNQGHVYVADESTIYLYRLSSALKVTAKWDTGTSSLLAVRLDRNGNVWVATVGNEIKEYTPGGKLVAHWGRNGKKSGQFDGPDALALDRSGNVYVADTNNNRVQKLSPQGKPLAVFGRSGNDLAKSNNPEGVAVDQHGTVYIADTYNDRIQLFSPTGRLLAIWSGA